MTEPVLTYTEQLPSKAGHYWVLTPFDSTPMMELLSIDEDSGQPFSLDSLYERHDYVLGDGYWFAGPVVQPALPEGFVPRSSCNRMRAEIRVE